MPFEAYQNDDDNRDLINIFGEGKTLYCTRRGTPPFWILAKENDVKWSHSVLSVKHTRLHQNSSIIEICWMEEPRQHAQRRTFLRLETLKEKLRHELNNMFRKSMWCIVCRPYCYTFLPVTCCFSYYVYLCRKSKSLSKPKVIVKLSNSLVDL